MGCGSSTVVKPAPVEAAPDKNGHAHIAAADVPMKPDQQAVCVITRPLADSPYVGAPAPICELQRKQHLDNLDLLDTEPERRFDDITKLCCMIFKAPIALVSLVDSERQWFKSVQGLQCSQTDRNSSFCAWTLLPAYPEALVVEDALEDARFKRNILVTGPPHIRFYAGCPLVCSNGLRLGSLCIIDTKPRKFDAESCSMLANMAEMVVREIEKEKALATQVARRNSLEATNQQMLLRAIDSFTDAIMLVNPMGDEWQVLYCNEACERLLKATPSNMTGTDFWSMFELVETHSSPSSATPSSRTSTSGQTASAQYGRAVQEQRNFQLHVALHLPSSRHSSTATSSAGDSPVNSAMKSADGRQHLVVQFRCALNTALDPKMPQVGIPSFLPNSTEAPTLYFAVISDPEKQKHHQQQQRAAPAFHLMPGSQAFADIKLGPLLGKGAFGRVYRGMWNGSTVAVKIIDFSAQEWQAGKLLEGLLSENLSHPNVVQTFKYLTRSSAGDAVESRSGGGGSGGSAGGWQDGGLEGDGPQMMEMWLVLEFCNRGCISDAVDKGWFRAKGSLFEPDMATIVVTAAEMASALAYLHSKGILHGDLTGNNVLLTKSAADSRGWAVKVSDFGLARQLTKDAPVIQTRSYGTVTHMPPELLMEGTMSMAVDVYSYGVVCWEMYMGHRPYGGMSHSQVLHAVSSSKHLQLPPAAPAAFRQLVHDCMAPKAAHRPTFAGVLARLEQIKAEMQIA